jgi:hypothetical protein
MMSKLTIVAALASPLVAVELVKGILFVMNKLYDLMAETLPSDATIVQSAIDLTTGHTTWVAIALSAYAIYMWRSRKKNQWKQLLGAAGSAAAIVMPASIYLLAK